MVSGVGEPFPGRQADGGCQASSSIEEEKREARMRVGGEKKRKCNAWS